MATFLSLGMFFLLSLPQPVLAYRIESLSTVEVKNDFAIGPGKTELFLAPGQTITKELLITNRLGKEMTFKIEIEDFRGSRSPEVAIDLRGAERGPYSLRDYLKPEVREFTLKQGERMVLPIVVALPTDAQPGGLYGAVIVRAEPLASAVVEEAGKAASQVRLVSRLASLFLVRVKGEVKEDTFLKEFAVAKKYYEKSPINFSVLVENNGTVHVNPYGLITITNFLGRTIGEVEIQPFFVLPDSVKLRTVNWERGFLLGRYQAKLALNRGYQDIIDERVVTFWVIPWKILLAALLVIGLLAWFIIWLARNFEFRRKS